MGWGRLGEGNKKEYLDMGEKDGASIANPLQRSLAGKEKGGLDSRGTALSLQMGSVRFPFASYICGAFPPVSCSVSECPTVRSFPSPCRALGRVAMGWGCGQPAECRELSGSCLAEGRRRGKRCRQCSLGKTR